MINMINTFKKEIPMINEVNAVTFRQNLGEMFNHVQYRHDAILIKKDGKPVAATYPIMTPAAFWQLHGD